MKFGSDQNAYLEPLSTRWKWWWFWLGGGVLLAGVEIIGNALMGRFPLLFAIFPACPLIAIPLNAVLYSLSIISAALLFGFLAELIRRIFRFDLSFHLAVAVCLLIGLSVYLWYGIYTSDLDKIDPSTGLPENYEHRSPFSLWWWVGGWGVAVIISVGAGCVTGFFRKRRIALLWLAVLFAGVAAFNIAERSIELNFSRLLLLAIVFITVIILWVILKLCKLTVRQLVTATVLTSSAAIIIEGIYFGWPGRHYDRHLSLMVWDALPALRMNLYGYRTPNTPTLNGLRNRMVLFDQAYSPANYTFASHVSIFTGRYLREHHLYDGTLDDIASYSTFDNLAEGLASKGYRPLLLTENPWVMPITKGFDISFSCPTRPRTVKYFLPFYRDTFLARQLIDHLMFNSERNFKWSILRIEKRWLTNWLLRARREGPYFIFSNWMYFHSRYCPMVSEEKAICDLPGEAHDVSIRFMDEYLQEWLDIFSSAGQLADSLFVLTADHGDFIGEFGMYEHSKTLLEPVLHVPLVIFGRDVSPRIILEPVPLVALKRAIEAIIPVLPGERWRIRDFCEAMLSHRGMVVEDGYDFKGPGNSIRWFLAAWDGNIKYMQDDHKRIHGSSEGLDMDTFYFLYDLKFDPGELDNLAEQRSNDLARMQKTIKDWEERLRPPPLEPKEEEEEKIYPPGLVEQLRALGYMR